ncbi:hypothetical protein E5D57_012257 [Metarhizium anisopliae]|nr:hypothetical protein E5D57_012257 [Metarhizium anisopliae]
MPRLDAAPIAPIAYVEASAACCQRPPYYATTTTSSYRDNSHRDIPQPSRVATETSKKAHVQIKKLSDVESSSSESTSRA